MRFTSRGIGWLIAGGIICATAISSDSFASGVGTAAFGLVFVAVYFIKQFFDPGGIGWFIAGGILTAFCIETMLGVTAGIFRNSLLDRDSLSDVLITLIIALGCFYAFYKRNKSEIDDVASDMGIDMYKYQYQPDHPEAPQPAKPEAASDVEFELTTEKESGEDK